MCTHPKHFLRFRQDSNLWSLEHLATALTTQPASNCWRGLILLQMSIYFTSFSMNFKKLYKKFQDCLVPNYSVPISKVLYEASYASSGQTLKTICASLNIIQISRAHQNPDPAWQHLHLQPGTGYKILLLDFNQYQVYSFYHYISNICFIIRERIIKPIRYSLTKPNSNF